MPSLKTGEHLLYAYVYGSTAKNCAREDSDVDLILMVKKPTLEEKRFMNSTEGGLFSGDRQGTMNFTFNSHYLFIILRNLHKKHGIEISPYYFYEGISHDQNIPQTPFTLASVLAGPHLRWPEDFQNIAYL